MFKSLVKMLGLKYYNFQDKNDNADASAIIVNLGEVTEKSEKDGAGNMDIDSVIGILEDFLTLPNGYRGFILIDDIHAANDAVKAKMLSWLRGKFESPDGMYMAKSPFGSKLAVRRPIRNLNIFLTLNPTADQEQIARYAKDKANPTSEEILLATLSSKDFKVEPSFLRRFGRIINLNYMPASAKGPELINSLAKASRTLLNTSNRIALVDPRVVNLLVRGNEQVDARSFLSASTSSLVEVVSDLQSNGSLVLVVPSGARSTRRVTGDSETSASEKISSWVRENSRPLVLDNSLEGNVAFIKLVVDAFRLPFYENMITGLEEDPRFAGDATTQKTILAPILAAISDHLFAHSYIYPNDLNLSARDFNMNTPGERDSFRMVIERLSADQKEPLLPNGFRQIVTTSGTWKDVLGGHAADVQEPYRELLLESVASGMQIAHKRLSQILEVSDIDVLPTSEVWLHDIPALSSLDPKQTGKLVGEQLWNLIPKMFESNAFPNEAQEVVNVYFVTRLYLHAMDKALIGLPWVRISRFLLQSLRMITEDQVLSQKAGVQNFLFINPYRLLKPTLPDLAFQILANSDALEHMTSQTRENLKSQYVEALGKIFSKGATQ